MSSNWLNFKEMLDDIKSYLEGNPDGAIIAKDNPLKLTIGYCCEKTGKEWHIGIRYLKNSSDDPEFSLLMKCLQSQAGKDKLLQVINSWNKPLM